MHESKTNDVCAQKGSISFRIEFSKIRFSPNFRILSFYIPKYLLLHYISISASNLHIFIASWHICLMPIWLIRMLENLRTRYLRNSIRSRIHLFNPRMTFTRIERVVISLIFSDTLTRDMLKLKMKRNSCVERTSVTLSFFFTIAFNRVKEKGI